MKGIMSYCSLFIKGSFVRAVVRSVGRSVVRSVRGIQSAMRLVNCASMRMNEQTERGTSSCVSYYVQVSALSFMALVDTKITMPSPSPS